MKRIGSIGATLLLFATLIAQAGEAEVRAAFAKTFPGVTINSVSSAAFDSDWYEVAVGRDILYVDKTGRYLFSGSVIDLTSRRNLTEERKEQLSRVNLKSLPNLATSTVKRVNGKGQRVLITFEDPYCGYCKKLAKELKKIPNLTVYTFLYPVITANSAAMSKQIWCSADRNKAWAAVLEGRSANLGKANCKNPIDQNIALGQRLQLGGVPAMVFPDGTLLTGYRTAEEIEPLLRAKSARK